ncbi:MAG: sensor histidine kinase KdpD [Micropepsaceae bacterium]
MPETREPPRPEPDALLAEAAREGRGRLKVYLGMAPGVGKTYAMLEGARRVRDRGADVVIGLIETHGRQDTQVLLQGFEILPRKSHAYRGQTLSEFDLDAALTRRPKLLIVDEYAHTNVPDSRHPKRWQDIEELLRAGVDVHTTLNIQHLDGLNDVVARITGVRVRETIPDQVLEKADEVELIDLTPEELTGRLREGKVYAGELAGRALESYFKPGNLSALRELALRHTADRVDQQMVGYMRAHAIEGPWPAGERIMVCIGADSTAPSVLRAGRRLADQIGAPWIAVHVERSDSRPLDATQHQSVEEAMKLAEQLNARVERMVGEDLPGELLAYARRNNVTQIVIGRSREGMVRQLLRRSLASELIRRSEGIPVHVVVPEPSAGRSAGLRLPGIPLEWRGWAYVFLSISVVVGLGFAISVFSTMPNMAVLFLTAVFVGSVLYGMRAGVATALLAFPVWNFFFIEPYYTFSVSSWSELLTLCIFLVIATVTGMLAGRVRDQARSAQTRVSALQTLFDFSRRLSASATPDTLLHAIVLQAHRLTALPSMALLPGPADLEIRYAWPPEDMLDAAAMAAARWCIKHGEPAGHGTSTLPAADWHFRPVRTQDRTVGVLGLRQQKADRALPQDVLKTLDSILDQSAVAIDRLRFAAEAARVEAMTATDRLRTALMSSVSHDLRTPLTTILGSASTLRQSGEKLLPDARTELLLAIEEETKRLDQYVTNLLNMSRLEAGDLKPRREWLDPGEVLDAAASRVAPRAHGIAIDTRLGPHVPLLRTDFMLLETVLVNLLDNALKHGEGAQIVSACAHLEGGKIVFRVIDDGVGIPSDYLDRLFDRFFRVQRGDSKPAGSGLGLSICKGFVEAMGGTITVQSPVHDGRGAAFVIEFPVELQPPREVSDAIEPE